MRYTMMAGIMALSMVGTGCVATHKYVAKTISPVEARVTTAENKNTEQDKALTDQKKQIEDVDRDLSRTKEQVTDVDSKATAAGQAAQQANQAAQQANEAASNAQKSADGAHSFAEQGMNRLEHTMDAMNKYQMTKSATVLFPLGQSKLSKDAKQQLDDFAKNTDGLQRYTIEVQGFTDKTGSATYNEALSQERAEAVARYLANEHHIPLHEISMLGSGYAMPVGNDKTREGRKQNRRVEVRLFVPEAGSGANAVAQAQE